MDPLVADILGILATFMAGAIFGWGISAIHFIKVMNQFSKELEQELVKIKTEDLYPKKDQDA